MRMRFALAALTVGAMALGTASEAAASSHREAPFISKMPKVDGTDFYMFRSYETGREGFVTIIANYQPLQDAYGGPNYFTMDSEALYEIHIDNNGNGEEDVTFQFRFSNALNGANGIQLPIGGKQIAIPLVVANTTNGTVTPFDLTTPRHVNETYGVKVVRGNRRTGTAQDISHTGGPGGNGNTFVKPLDMIGEKTFGDQGDFFLTKYNAYANAHIYTNVTIPGCATAGSKIFVGQRREMFAVNLGTIFDLVNAPLNAIVDPDGGTENLYAGSSGAIPGVGSKNVTSIAMEIPIACIKGAGDIVGGWTTASVRQARVINPAATYAKPSREGGAWAQVSRLGMPLVNEVVIGLKDKDKFNSSEPKDDATNFADYVTNPSLPVILQAVFGTATYNAPNVYPRTDLVQVFATGVTGVNNTGAKVAEMLRLNTALPAIPANRQFRGNAGGGGTGRGLGAAGCFVNDADNTKPKKLDASAGNLVTAVGGTGTCDPSGFPNGRRPGDDVVDLALRVVSGYLLSSGAVPQADLPFGYGIQQAPNDQFVSNGANHVFPYLPIPNRGAGTGL